MKIPPVCTIGSARNALKSSGDGTNISDTGCKYRIEEVPSGDFDHIVTIGNTSNTTGVNALFIYNLAGQKVNRQSMTKGVYIIGNKKVIIK